MPQLSGDLTGGRTQDGDGETVLESFTVRPDMNRDMLIHQTFMGGGAWISVVVDPLIEGGGCLTYVEGRAKFAV